METELYIQTRLKDHLFYCLKLPEWKNHPDYEKMRVDYYAKIIKINKFILKFAR